MQLSDEDRRAIGLVVAEELRSTLVHDCRCGLSEAAQKELSHFMGMCSDLGGGKHAQGIEQVRDAVRFVSQWRKTSERVGTGVLILVLFAVGGCLGLMVRLGFKAWVNR